ncbi:MAG: AraC family transcriptional regulator [Flavobacteriaceae bacterium]
MTLYIKYMVSLRCKMLVKNKLEKIGLKFFTVNLGEVKILESISEMQREKLKNALAKCGLELMDDKRAVIIEKIKTSIVEMVHHQEALPKVKFSNYLSDKLDYDYTYLSNLFSQTEGITIEQFILKHKIEKVKELILYDELNLTEISYRLNYSSVAALSNQFKKITGLTPSYFKQLKEKRLVNLESL